MGIVGVLLGLLDYQLWIGSIFALKRDKRLSGVLAEPVQLDVRSAQEQLLLQPVSQVLNVEVPLGVQPGHELHVTSPDGQTLQVCVPEGACAGQQFTVSYLP